MTPLAEYLQSLNPSSDGIPALGPQVPAAMFELALVLILLLMEYPLWESFHGWNT